MANTYTQIYIHIIFAPSHRERLIMDSFRERLHRYISVLVSNKGSKLLAINSMDDHIHIFLGLNPSESVSELVKVIKTSSANFINEKGFLNGCFSWQTGYAAFSYSHSQIPSVIKYIEKQKEHHKVKSFKEEYVSILKAFSVEHKDSYLFKWTDAADVNT